MNGWFLNEKDIFRVTPSDVIREAWNPFQMTSCGATRFNVTKPLTTLYSLKFFIFFKRFFKEGHVLISVCQPHITDYGPDEKSIQWALWIYFANKLFEFMDTFVFVARKKFNQVSFLHVYHHFTMPLYCFFRLNWYTIGQGMLFSAVNSFVHVVMYSYYFLAAIGPSVRPWLWWKKYITKLQLVQFAYGLITEGGVIVGLLNCGFPKLPAVVTFACIHFPMGLMFANFYSKSYKKAGKAIAGEADAKKIE